MTDLNTVCSLCPNYWSAIKTLKTMRKITKELHFLISIVPERLSNNHKRKIYLPLLKLNLHFMKTSQYTQ